MKDHRDELEANFSEYDWKKPFICYQGNECKACLKAMGEYV